MFKEINKIVAYCNAIIENINQSRVNRQNAAKALNYRESIGAEDNAKEINLDIFHPDEDDIDLDDNPPATRLSSPIRGHTLRSSMTKKFSLQNSIRAKMLVIDFTNDRQRLDERNYSI